MLEELYFHKTHWSTFDHPLHIPKQSLPNLCHYEGLVEYIVSFVPGRPIHTVIVSLYCSSLDIPTLNFGSLTPIRSLTLNCAGDLLGALRSAVLACPTLHELTVTPPYDMDIAPVCIFQLLDPDPSLTVPCF